MCRCSFSTWELADKLLLPHHKHNLSCNHHYCTQAQPTKSVKNAAQRDRCALICVINILFYIAALIIHTDHASSSTFLVLGHRSSSLDGDTQASPSLDTSGRIQRCSPAESHGHSRSRTSQEHLPKNTSQGRCPGGIRYRCPFQRHCPLLELQHDLSDFSLSGEFNRGSIALLL